MKKRSPLWHIIFIVSCLFLLSNVQKAAGGVKPNLKLKQRNDGYLLNFHKKPALKMTLRKVEGKEIETHEWCMALKIFGFPKLVPIMSNYKSIEQNNLVQDWERFTKNGVFELICIQPINGWKKEKIEEIPESLRRLVFEDLSIEDIKNTKSQYFSKGGFSLVFVDLIYSAHAYKITKEKSGTESLEILLNSQTDLALISYNDQLHDICGQYNITFSGHLDRKLTLEERYACSYGKPQVVLAPCD